jgi:type II secretory pathway pseudopilin PulG
MSVQRGFAMIAILALVALIAAFLIASALNRTAADVSNEREDRSMSALRKAKAALITYAANEQWQLHKALPKTPSTDPSVYFQPGALACPDQDDDGDADCILPNTASLIGRVPYKTIGLDDVRDASGERLWYALSHNFRKLRCTSIPPPPTPPSPSGCTMINSDTQGQLTVVGIAPATQVVAVLFAPGEALQGQNRDPTNASAHNNPLNYLEGPPNLGDPVNYVFTTALPSATFNDRVLVITKAELMDAVEPVVAANIERDVKPLVQDYITKWGAYPFAMTFAAPPTSVTDYKGTPPPPPPPLLPGENKGLLPLTDDPTWFKWWKATVTQITPGGYLGTEVVTASNCSINSSPPQAVCHINYSDSASPPDNAHARPDIKLQIFLQNANTAFADIPSPIALPQDVPNFTITADGGGIVTDQGPPYGQFSNAGVGGPAPPPTTTFLTQTAVVAETGVIVYTGRLQNSADMGGGVTLTISLPPPRYLPITSSDFTVNPNGWWFIANQWYRDAYYAVSPGYVSGGVPFGNPAACTPTPPPATPSCLTVNNLAAPTNNKRAIIVLAGRQLNGTTRPASGNPADYFENANLTAANGTAPFVYQHRAGLPTSINDRVVVVSP